MATLGEQFKELYKAGETVKVEFEKRDGSIRTMVCERKKEMEEAVKGAITKKDDSVLRVVELKDDGTTQWRSVPLDRVRSVGVVSGSKVEGV